MYLQHAGTNLQIHRDSVDTKNSVGYTQGSALGISELTIYFKSIRQPLRTRNLVAQTSMGTHVDVGACRHANFKRHAMIQADTGGKLRNRKDCFSHRAATSHSKLGGSNVHGNPCRRGCMSSCQLQKTRHDPSRHGRETQEPQRLFQPPCSHFALETWWLERPWEPMSTWVHVVMPTSKDTP